MQEIDVEKIMQDIREDIKKKGYQASELSFQDIPIPGKVAVSESFNMNELKDNLNRANTSIQVDFYKPITSGGIKGFAKKVVRKLIKPIMYPLCQQQENFNAYSVRAENQLMLYVQELEKRVEALETILKNEKER